MKIGFVTDTNLLKKTEDRLRVCEKTLDDTDIFVEYIEALSKTETTTELIYFMPNLVIEELFSQKKRIFQEQYDLLQERFKNISYGLVGEIPKSNIEDIINKEKAEYLPKYKNVNLTYTQELFESLVNDAINKKAPFDKSVEGKKTDAGFKDALIWKTILQSEEVGKCNIFYFFSSDKIFIDNKSELVKEFSNYHNNSELKIVYFDPDGNQRQKALQLLISENNLVETNVVKLYNKELILSAIKTFKFDYDKDVLYSEEDEVKVIDISFVEFLNEDFIISDVNDNEGEYEVIISFETKKYILNNLQEEKNRILLGNIKIYYSINNNEINLKAYKIDNVRFYRNYLNRILSSIGESVAKIYSEEFKTSIENLKKALEINLEPLKNINYTSQFQELKNSMSTINSFQEIAKSINSLKQFEEIKKSISSINEFNLTNNTLDSLKSLSDTKPIKYIDNNKKED